MEINFNLNVIAKEKKEPITTHVGIPVSLTMKKQIEDLKQKDVPVNTILRDVLEKLIKQVG